MEELKAADNFESMKAGRLDIVKKLGPPLLVSLSKLLMDEPWAL